MKWSEVRELYPDRWVMVTALDSRVENGKQYVEDVAVVRPLKDDKEAKNTLMQCKGDTFVYHTLNPEIVIEIAPNPHLRSTYAH